MGPDHPRARGAETETKVVIPPKCSACFHVEMPLIHIRSLHAHLGARYKE